MTTSRSPLPDGWEWLPLGELGAWRGGGTPSKADPRFWQGGKVPWVSPKDMKVERIRDSEDHITLNAVENSAANLIPSGSVLVVTRSGILERTLPVAVSEVELTTNQDLKALTPRDGINGTYVAMALRAFERDILGTCSKSGTTVASIEFPRLKAFEIPIAPPFEQDRIVAEVQKQFTRLDAGTEALRQTLAHVRRFRASVLRAACESRLSRNGGALLRPAMGGESAASLLSGLPGRVGKREAVASHSQSVPSPSLPDGWVLSRFADLVQNHDGRRVPIKAADRARRHGPFPYYGASGIIDSIDDFIFDGEFLLVAEDGANLLSRSTPIAFKVAGQFWVNNHAHVVSPYPGVLLDYLRLVLNGMNLQFSVTGSAQPKLTQANLNELPIPLPPTEIQKVLVAEVERLFSEAEALERTAALGIRRGQRLRSSVLRAAFCGSLCTFAVCS